MGDILGLGTTDYPRLRSPDPAMTGPLQGNLRGSHLKEEMKDPSNWPKPMQAEWGDDEGLATGQKARAHQIEQFEKLRGELDAFKPDFVLAFSKDSRESLKNFSVPQFWVQAHDSITAKVFQGPGARESGETFFGQDFDREVELAGHPEGARHLIRGLQDAGFDPAYSTETMHPTGLAHTFCGVVTHLDWGSWEFKTPFVPVSLDPFGLRQRGPDGCEPLTEKTLPPITAQRAFDLGRNTARILKASPWKVALVAGVGWSHANNTSWEKSWVHPDIEADKRRYEEFAANKFGTWNKFTPEEFEEHGQWELLCWIALAGAMTELGATIKWSDFEGHYIFNSVWVNCAFNVA
ncbi:MAG: hypothetical protein V3S98_00910 [Dehalococcoidia bacterium]